MDYRSRPKEQHEKTEPKQTTIVTGDVTNVTGKVSEPDVLAGEKTCILYARLGKVSVTVWDYDSSGNRQDVVYRGKLEKGEKQKISSYTGIIIFSYQPYGDDKSYGDNRGTCENGNTIEVR